MQTHVTVLANHVREQEYYICYREGYLPNKWSGKDSDAQTIVDRAFVSIGQKNKIEKKGDTEGRILEVNY